jgi:hypothetical protein
MAPLSHISFLFPFDPNRSLQTGWKFTPQANQTDAQSLDDLLFLMGEFSPAIAGLYPLGLQSNAFILPDG